MFWQNLSHQRQQKISALEVLDLYLNYKLDLLKWQYFKCADSFGIPGQQLFGIVLLLDPSVLLFRVMLMVTLYKAMSREWWRSISTRQTALKIEDRPIIPIPVHPMAYAFEPICNYVPEVVPYDAKDLVLSEDINMVDTDKLISTAWCTCTCRNCMTIAWLCPPTYFRSIWILLLY